MTTFINYTLPSGKTAVITIEATKSWSGKFYATVSAKVAGIGTPMTGGVSRPSGLPAWAVSAIDRLPLTADADAQVGAAVAAINAQFAAHNAQVDAHAAELDAITDRSESIRRRMAC